MSPLLLAGCLLPLSGLCAMAPGRLRRAGVSVAVWGCVVSCLIAAFPVGMALLNGTVSTWSTGWSVPGGSFSLRLDGLSAFFLAPLLLLSALGAVYGRAYLAGGENELRGSAWFFYNALVLSMGLVFLADNGLLFLVAWEAMALSSFFLVILEDEKPSTRQAGLVYLVATHIGTAFLLVFFLLLGRESNSLDFATILAAGTPDPRLAGALFVLAMVGFGAKAGFAPLHVWLPEAYPAAPGHVPALMSGAMSKTGVYGILRTLAFMGAAAPWQGWTLLGVGLVSAIFGIVMALGQKELKRLLAYSSVENVGIITMGLGLGALGRAWNQPALSFLGFGGALFHALNHSLFKGLLFFGAGSVLRGTGTGNLERLGGLGKRMPWTAALFVVGAAAISGLPPFNGFAGEFLLYMAGLGSAAGGSGSGVLLGVLVVAGLALVGTLSMAVFARAVGVAFLCEARSPEAERARESGPSITAPMLILAVACVAFGFLGFKVVEVLPNALAPLLGDDMELAGKASARAGSLLLRVGLVFLFLTIFAGALLLFRRWLLAGRVVAGGPTWDCGYARPTARMQYTASSFGAPLLEVFGSLVRSLRRERAVRGFFPKSAGYETSSPDGAWRYLFAPLFQGIGRLLEPVRKLQQGSIHLYVLYMALTLIALLIWKVGMGE